MGFYVFSLTSRHKKDVRSSGRQGGQSDREESKIVKESVFTVTDLFVGGSVGEADALDLWTGVSRRTGATAEARGSVNAAYAHVTWLHSTLGTKKPTETHLDMVGGKMNVKLSQQWNSA